MLNELSTNIVEVLGYKLNFLLSCGFANKNCGPKFCPTIFTLYSRSQKCD